MRYEDFKKETLLALGIAAVSAGVAAIQTDITTAVAAVALGFAILIFRGYQKIQ